MNSVLIVGCSLISVALALAFLALRRAQHRISGLQAALALSTEAQVASDSVLLQRTRKDTVKDEFISTVSHELRTPLTSIRGALGLLSAGLMGDVDVKAQSLLRIAVTNTDRLIRLLNDILDLERMQSGRAPLHTRRCSLRDLVQQSIDTMAPMAEAAHVQLALRLAAPPAAVFFDGDPDSIQQLLTNLLSNAIKFSPPHSVVQVRIEADPDSVLLRISDQGRGIPVDMLDTVFDRFQQVDAADARQKGGTGLGLAICRTIVQQHNGSIWAESNEQQQRGPGASLLVTLPRLGRVQDTTAIQPITMLSNSFGGTIIICDDDASIRTVVGEKLRQHGYEILEASSGEQAIELALAHQVEAILLDLYMPGLSGWETLKQLKGSASMQQIPVVILSVLSPLSATTTQPGIAASVQGWVQKPFNEHRLLAELSRVLNRSRSTPHVLLVEDDDDLAAVVVTSFKDADVYIEHAGTRQDAIERCMVAPPDLLILDLTLPDGDGFSLVNWMRRQPDLRALPLVVYSGRELSDFERSRLRLGPTHFLRKGQVQPPEVETLVMNIVQELSLPVASDADCRPA